VIELNYWIFVPEVWLIFGLILVIADVFLGFNFFVLPVGVASFIISALIYGENNMLFGTLVLFKSWKVVVLYFAGLSLVSVSLLRFVFQRRKKNQPDINEY